MYTKPSLPSASRMMYTKPSLPSASRMMYTKPSLPSASRMTILSILLLGIAAAQGTEMVEPANPSVPMFVHEGGSFTLGCRNTLVKPIQWEKDGHVMSEYGSRRVLVSQWVTEQYGERVTVSSLRIAKASIHDQARYACRAAKDERPREVQVFILALETLDAQLSGHWERGHNDATLRCNPEQGPLFESTLSWYDGNGKLVDPDSTDTSIILLDNNKTLFFRDLAYPQDVHKIGKYECVLRLSTRGITFAKNAYVKAAAIVDDIYAEEDGDDVSVVCLGHSYPMPTVSWRKDGHLVHMEADKYRSSVSEGENNGFVATLTVRDYDGKDHGNYTCLLDSLVTDYQTDDMKTLMLDGVYYSAIHSSSSVSHAGAVIGILIAVLFLFYIIIVIIVIIRMVVKKRQASKGIRLDDEESDSLENSPMLSVPAHGRPRHDTMSDTDSRRDEVPINGLLLQPADMSDEDNQNQPPKSDSGGSEDSIHKEKIHTSEEDDDSGSSPDQTHVFIVPPDEMEGDHMRQEDQPHQQQVSPPKPLRQPRPEDPKPRPPSLEDLLAAERDSYHTPDEADAPAHDYVDPPRHSPHSDYENDVLDKEEEAPPLPPKTKHQEEYLDMTGSLGRGSTYQRGSTLNRNGSRKLGDAPLPNDDDSSIDGETHGETEVVIEPKPKEPYDTAV